MAAELIDFRVKVTLETDAALDAIARATGKDRAEIARDVLHVWAQEQIAIATLLSARVAREGLAGETRGKGGEGTGNR